MAYALCQNNPQMKITVCELPSVVNCANHFRPCLENCPNQENVSFVASDFLQSDLPKADLYVICRTLHNWSEEKIDLILSKVFKCLPSGMYLNHCVCNFHGFVLLKHFSILSSPVPLVCLRNFAHRDWSVRVHYSSIKHDAYVSACFMEFYYMAVFQQGLESTEFMNLIG